ncbi:hypothetical protein, partial [Porphyromonas sp.]|uniref:hypothetical protein n=1 Tax=Porphyromonas sp. TaxID=1924944 RepID=UPI003AB79A4B
AFCTFTLCVEHRETLQIPLISIYLPAILSLILFPLIVPPLEPKSSSAGTKKFQRWNNFWSSYVLEREHDTKQFAVSKRDIAL